MNGEQRGGRRSAEVIRSDCLGDEDLEEEEERVEGWMDCGLVGNRMDEVEVEEEEV